MISTINDPGNLIVLHKIAVSAKKIHFVYRQAESEVTFLESRGSD